jgi:hypothetical protein
LQNIVGDFKVHDPVFFRDFRSDVLFFQMLPEASEECFGLGCCEKLTDWHNTTKGDLVFIEFFRFSHFFPD